MHDVLNALNKLVADRVIRAYAIGGAIGAAFYIEAAQTEDVDAFVFLPDSNSGLVLLAPIYDALTAMGGLVEREYVRFGNWPLQILTDANPLIAEAIQQAVHVDYDGISTRVFRAEYLCAIALQTGRTKDYLRVTMFLEQNAVDQDLLMALLDRYGLKLQIFKIDLHKRSRRNQMTPIQQQKHDFNVRGKKLDARPPQVKVVGGEGGVD